MANYKYNHKDEGQSNPSGIPTESTKQLVFVTILVHQLEFLLSYPSNELLWHQLSNTT